MLRRGSRGPGPPPTRTRRRPDPHRKPRLLCRPSLRPGQAHTPAERLRGDVRAPPPRRWSWHVGPRDRQGWLSAQPGRASCPTDARLRRDRISAATKAGNGGAGPEMPLKGRGRPGSAFPGGAQGATGAPTRAAPGAVAGHHGDGRAGPFITPAGAGGPAHTLHTWSLVAPLVTGLPVGKQPPSPATDHTPGRRCQPCAGGEARALPCPDHLLD